MVKSDTRLIIAIAAVLFMVAAFAYIALSDVKHIPVIDEYPADEIVSFRDIQDPEDTPRDLKVSVSYHADRIYEGTEFKVKVLDSDGGTPVVDADVSFMTPLIHLDTKKEGFVYFSAPKIQDEYLLHLDDTSRTFPITVNKEGYNSYTTSITVHLAP